MSDLALIRVGVPRGTPVEQVWDAMQSQTALSSVSAARLYQPTRGFFEPTEWVYAALTDGPIGEIRLPGETLPLRKFDIYPFRGEVNPYNISLFDSGLPMQLVTITVVPPGIEQFEDWYGEHADVLSRAVGAMGALRYWQEGPPRRYASLYYYESEEGIEKYLVSDVRLKAAESRLPYDPWLVDQHHAYYKDITPA